MHLGLWLEPEVIGVESATAATLPEEAFQSRAGVRIVEHDRYLLDLRHPSARAHLDEVVDRLVRQFDTRYFKFDYNVTPGAGPDTAADSPGAALLEHNRAHLEWLDAVHERHPRLVIENCASGAMRSDFAMLSRLQLQSTSDQQDPLLYPPIAASAPLSMLPEQAASWAYPQPEMTLEASAFALTTGLLGRYFVSGFLNRMDDERRALVAEAVVAAKGLRSHIRTSHLRLPLGLPGWDDPRTAMALLSDDRLVISVWDRVGGSTFALHLPDMKAEKLTVATLFPLSLTAWSTTWNPATQTLTVRNPTDEPGARTFGIDVPKPSPLKG
jgi:alpha-galactosidase